jgi:prophage maintenance system killer protein
MTKEKYPHPQVWLNIKICEAIYKAYKEFGPQVGVGVPIPDFDTRYPNALESILGAVQYKSRRLGYDVKKTAVYYFFYLVKSQCFLDANKRLAVIYTDFFLRLNKYKINMKPTTLRDIAIIISRDTNLSVSETAETTMRIFDISEIGG